MGNARGVNGQSSGLTPNDSWSDLLGLNDTIRDQPSTGSTNLSGTQFRDAHSAPAMTQSSSRLPADNPNGRGIFIYVHGTASNDSTWTPSFINSVNQTYKPAHQEFFDWDASGQGTGKSSAAMSDIKGNAPEDLNTKISELKDKYPGQPVMVIGHSNGGNVAVGAAEIGGQGTPDYIVRFGSPIINDLSTQQMANLPTKVLDVYDPTDRVRSQYSAIAGGGNRTPANTRNWAGYEVDSPWRNWLGIKQHLSEHSPEVWDQIQAPLEANGFMRPFGGRISAPKATPKRQWLE